MINAFIRHGGQPRGTNFFNVRAQILLSSMNCSQQLRCTNFPKTKDLGVLERIWSAFTALRKMLLPPEPG